MRAAPALLAALAVAACAPAPGGPPVGPPIGPGGAELGADARVLGRFGDARALATDPAGRLYVVDAAESAVVVLSPAGMVLAALGGPGTRDGAFLDPADVDPTNGQAIFIADAGAGTVAHVTAEGRTAETVAVPEVDPSRAAQAVGLVLRALPRGRPVAVAAAPDGALYVVEAERGVVLRLDEQRGVERVLGGPEAGPAALARPVDVAVDDEGTVWVADAGRGVLQPFDAFGAPGPAVPVGGPGGPVAVDAAGDELVVVGPASVTVRGASGDAVRAVDLGEPLVGAATTTVGLYVLTRTRLVRLAAPERPATERPSP